MAGAHLDGAAPLHLPVAVQVSAADGPKVDPIDEAEEPITSNWFDVDLVIDRLVGDRPQWLVQKQQYRAALRQVAESLLEPTPLVGLELQTRPQQLAVDPEEHRLVGVVAPVVRAERSHMSTYSLVGHRDPGPCIHTWHSDVMIPGNHQQRGVDEFE
ncbi:hypothetical protein GCM10020255_078110 [Rhodococcus baikonurensis]